MFRFPSLDLIRVSAVVALACCLILGSLGLDGALRERTRADRSLEELHLFDLAAAAALSITAERRPLEFALDLDLNENVGAISELRGARINTDLRIEAFRSALGALADSEGMNFGFLQTVLRDERRRADALLILPLDKRLIGAQLSAARGMSTISDAFKPFVDKVSKRVILANENLAGRVNIARLLSTLYESAARLPTEVMPALRRGEMLPPEAGMTAMRLRQRILALWDVGLSQLEYEIASKPLQNSLEEIRATYFGRGFPYISYAIETFSRRPMRGSENARAIAQVYGPTIEPIAQMRDRYLQWMMVDAAQAQANATRQAQIFLGLTAASLFAAAIFALTGYRQILKPLLGFRDQILAACERKPFERVPYHGSVAAVRHLYRALETLEARDRERLALDRERTALSEKLRALSETDDLTHLPNRRGLFDQLSRFSLSDQDYVAILVDIDHFKAVNDTHGHGVGDEVLFTFAQCLKTRMGPDVLVARYGGEEFALAVRAQSPERLVHFAEMVRTEIENLHFATSEGILRLTASFGVAHERGPVSSWPTLLSLADKALYEAKAAGRNRVRLTNAAMQLAGKSGRSEVGAGDASAPAILMTAV
ncbi:GGDEF domain-containing protein [Aureimonas sp. ME7]|uniref:GGDEF domain-containing protein n=1 Tax=Aureimonas sp. ME7 TaxID=2744252 RepID=UPI0015F41B75|nr:GGDEF domain-containing protein [Aureimonas sp. ME7]